MSGKGSVLVHMGEGKGKTTAALGLCMRFLGWDKKVCVIQFLKSEDFACGERNYLQKAGVEIYAAGIGYSWTGAEEEQKAALKQAWELAQKKLSEEYDLVVLDEILNVFSQKNVDFSDILTPASLASALKQRRTEQSVVLTGRNAPDELLFYADYVTEMKSRRHPFENGKQAEQCLEY